MNVFVELSVPSGIAPEFVRVYVSVPVCTCDMLPVGVLLVCGIRYVSAAVMVVVKSLRP